jgi:hypothetical protein
MFHTNISNTWLRAPRLWIAGNGFGNIISIIRRKAFHFSDLRALFKGQDFSATDIEKVAISRQT